MNPERPIPISPREAVADAMMVAQARFIHAAVDNNNSQMDFDMAMNKASRGTCATSSFAVLRHIFENYRGLFNVGVFLEGEQTYDFPYHTVFMMQGIDSRWYAGSPGNNTNRLNRFKLLYESDNMEDIVDRLQEDEGGFWPPTQTIRESIEQGANAFCMPKGPDWEYSRKFTIWPPSFMNLPCK